MKKKNLILSAALVLTISSTAVSPLMADTTNTNNYSTVLSLLRSQQIDKLLDRVNQLQNYTKLYMYQTGDINPTIDKVKNYFSLPDTATANFTKGQLSITTDNNTYQYKIGNLFNSPPSKELITLLNNSSKLNSLASVSSDGMSIVIPYSPTTINFVNTAEHLPSNAVISVTAPGDTTKTWYQPTGDGRFNIMQYNSTTGQWASIGSFKKDGIVVNSANDLKNFSTSANIGTKAYVKDGNVLDTYIYDGEKWVKASVSGNGSAGGMFNGTAGIQDLATTIFGKAGGSIATASAPNGEWSGGLDFTKKDDTQTGGYWISKDGRFVVTDKLSTLVTLSNLFNKGTTAWIPGKSGGILKLEKTTLPDGEVVWAYVAKNYADALKFKDEASDGLNGGVILVLSHNEFLKRNPDSYSPITGNTYINWSGRSGFMGATKGYRYLTNVNDCSALTCNGDAAQNYYAGMLIDGLYAFYYAPNANKNLNSLTDAQPYTNWLAMWSDLPAAVIWQGDNFGDVKNSDILVKVTLNGAPAYKDMTLGGKIVNKAQGYIIPFNKLPSDLNAENAMIVKHNGKNYVKTHSLDEFALDTDLPVGYTVYLNGSGLNKYLQECTPYGKNNLWSDNCNNVVHDASVAISNGSRSDLPAPVNNNRINLTKQAGSEPRYTPNGVSYKGDNTWKQWFYATTGKITDNMLDAIPCGDKGCYQNELAKKVGIGVTKKGYAVHYGYKKARYGDKLWTTLDDKSLYVWEYNPYYKLLPGGWKSKSDEAIIHIPSFTWKYITGVITDREGMPEGVPFISSGIPNAEDFPFPKWAGYYKAKEYCQKFGMVMSGKEDELTGMIAKYCDNTKFCYGAYYWMNEEVEEKDDITDIIGYLNNRYHGGNEPIEKNTEFYYICIPKMFSVFQLPKK